MNTTSKIAGLKPNKKEYAYVSTTFSLVWLCIWNPNIECFFLSFAIQFAVMAAVYTCVWITIRVFPKLLYGTDKLFLYGLVHRVLLLEYIIRSIVQNQGLTRVNVY